MLQKILKIGNSLGVTLPREFVIMNKIKDGVKVLVTYSDDEITYSAKASKITSYEKVSDKEFFDLVRDVDKKYSKALDELANLP